MRLLATFGETYRLTEKQYKKLLTDVASGVDCFILGEYGTYVGTVENVTDLDADYAQVKLDVLKQQEVEDKKRAKVERLRKKLAALEAELEG